MRKAIPPALRKLVAERAEFKCEYCLMTEEDSLFSFQLDHIISLKHNGNTDENNLAYSCITCNARKGSNISTILLPELNLIPLFNPRIDNWAEHFEISNEINNDKNSLIK